jgi:hypothetical protein
MSGIVGHTFYAVLGLKAAVERKLPLAAVAHRHFASYLAGAYLGSDIQVMPEAICLDTGREVGFGTVPLEKSPLTGGPVRQFRLATPEGALTAYQVHERFYGRSHLVFGWKKSEVALRVPWDHLADYFAAAIEDAFALFGPGERPIAYALGWIVHVVSDSLIKSIQPGVDLQLLDGKYTARNRPVQDLVTFHELGAKEFHLRWAALFEDLADTPVEPLQLHYMRATAPRGELARLFPDGWQPDAEPTLRAVLAENRRYVRQHAHDVLASLQMHDTPTGPECTAELREISGLTYAEMIEAARAANFRHALWQIGEQIGEMFAAVSHRCAPLASLPAGEGPSWSEIGAVWKRK